jgi:hypothetical protein
MMDNPQFPQEFSSVVIDLGAPLRYFPIKNLNRIGSLVAFFIFLIGAALAFFYGIYSAYTSYQKHGLAVVDDKLIVPVIVAIVLFLLALLGGLSAFNNWNKGVLLYEKGFAIRSRKGFCTWRLDEIVSMTAAVTRHYTNGIYTGTTHVYTLFNRQNEKLILNDIYKKVDELAEAVGQNIFPRLYERAAQEYNEGKPLTFGPVTTSKAGIQVGKKVYPWTEVKEVSIQQGTLKVSKKEGGWFSGAAASAAAIPNLRVLLAIINQVVGLKTGK